jgi:small nuclear ribonucleoprotein (snRNP)-like protein
MAAPPSSNVDVEAVRGLLGKPLRCTLSDGRRVVGKFVCLDRFANVLLREAEEVPAPGSAEPAKRLGMVMVPGAHLRTAEAAEPPAAGAAAPAPA